MSKISPINDDQKPKDPILKKVLERGIPVWRSEFHSAINNTDNVPETFFCLKSNVPSRRVQMWWINGDGLLCLHKGEYFLVPSASVKFVKFGEG